MACFFTFFFQEEYEKHLEIFSEQLQLDIKTSFDKIDNELLPAQIKRYKIWLYCYIVIIIITIMIIITVSLL